MFWHKKNGPHEAPDDDSSLEQSLERLEQLVNADPSIWRVLAFGTYAKVRDELKRLDAQADGVHEPPVPENDGQTRESVAASCEQALHEALQAMVPEQRRGRGGPRRWWHMLKLFYSGTRIEQAWLAIHRARGSLYLLFPTAELPAQIESLQNLVEELPESGTRKSLITVLGRLKANTPTATTNTELREIYEQAMGVSDALQREARTLRNTLMTASAAIFAVVLTLGVAHVLDKQIVELCLHQGKKELCPLGGALHPLDVFTVELAGMLGGLLSVVIPLATGERVQTPYRIFNQQLVLKTFAGAASALAGVILVESELIAGFTFKTASAVLGYAIVFGFAQQIVTGAVDRRANSLAKQTPSAKDV
jgi:hypothetical protein